MRASRLLIGVGGVAGIAATVAAIVAAGHVTAASSPSEIELIENPASPGSAEPNLAVSPDGVVYMTWLEPRDSGHALRVSAYDGSRWSPPGTIRTGRDFFVNWADFPSLEVLADGRLAAHWLQRTAKGTYAYGVRIAQSSDGGTTWSPAVIPHRDTSPNEHGFVALWRDGEQLGAAWLDGRKFDKAGHSPTNEMMLAATTISGDGRRDAELRLDERVCDCCQTSAALTSNGPILVYRDRTPDEIRDIAIVRRIGGRWTSPVRVHADGWRINACPVNGPAVATRANRVAVAWFTAANDSPRVKVAFSANAGATFGSAARVDDGNPGGRVDVHVLGDGSALVSWIERVGGDTAELRLRRVLPEGRAGRSMTVATSSAARASGFPRLAVRGQSALLAWTEVGRPSAIRVARVSLASIP
jgi:hypothetical protein